MQLEARKNEVVGFLPFRSGQTVNCRVLGKTPDGSLDEWIEYYPAEKVRKELARCFALDLSVQADQLRQKYHRSPPLPMFLADGRILVPFKFRLAPTQTEAGYGYIDYNLIRSVAPDKPHQCLLTLNNGRTLPVHSKIGTARLALYFAGEIKKDYFPEDNLEPDLSSLLKLFKDWLRV